MKDRFKHLSRWGEHAKNIAKTPKEIYPNAEVYVFRGVAEDRITVLSDIDILIVFNYKLEDKEIMNLRKRIFFNAVDKHGLPFDSPVKLHVVDDDKAKLYFTIAKKLIKVD
ncbi:nucleotidyltransferase domain-containing protein [Sulfurisphaera javensis]|uniref:Nucleotidyltransferase domain-containing protein n=1 Tax=Sulfurisphaera javensis TaxID=2049879 RepID=A0AAT9GPY1_9CREN